MNVCKKCNSELEPWELICSTCNHKQTLINIKSVEDYLTKMFSKRGIDYDEFKALIEGEKI